MFQEIEALGEITIMQYNLRVFNKDAGKLIIDRAIKNKENAIIMFNDLVNIYHNLNGRYTITLYDLEKCTNIESYDSDDNI